jgi:hypothetical protein
MAKRKLVEARNDFSGGLNTSRSPDQLQPNELMLADDVELSEVEGTLLKRQGSRKLTAARPAGAVTIDGIYVWDGPSGPQIVAVANGDLWWFNIPSSEYSGTWSQENPATAFQTGGQVTFAQMRSTGASGSLLLYIADGTNVYSWNGTSTLTKLTGTTSMLGFQFLAPFNTRMFYGGASTFLNHIFWSQIGNPADLDIDGADDGGSAIVNISRGDKLTATIPGRSSLWMATQDTIARFTGYSDEDIQIGQDTEGISSTIGIVGPNAAANAEGVVFFLSDNGPYVGNDQGIQPIGLQVDPTFQALPFDELSKAMVVFNKASKSVWYAVDPDGNGVDYVYVYSLRLGAWTGPYKFPFVITSLAEYEDADGKEGVVAGCSDGWVRKLDVSGVYQDNQDSDGSNGSTYNPIGRLAPFFFDSGPGVRKMLWRAAVQANINTGSGWGVTPFVDGSSGTVQSEVGVGNGYQNYRVDFANDQGDRIWIQFSLGTQNAAAKISGCVIYAFDMGRMI